VLKVPAFLLKRLYVKGSLRNSGNGFALTLKNTLGSGYAQGMLPIRVDGADVPLPQASFIWEGKVVPFPTVTKEAPFTLGLNREIGIQVEGAPLSSGAHRIGIGFTVVGLGDLRFEVVDEVRP
jgi:hypothetical protein